MIKTKFKNREELLAIEFVLKQVKKLSKKRYDNFDDAKEEQGTYNDGYWEAFNDLVVIIRNKYELK